MDATRGVHKAPANEPIRGVVDLSYRITRAEQETLNPAGVNCIRYFPADGIRVWGARSLAAEASQWRYLSVRRLFSMLKESIGDGTRWIVFEPNDQLLFTVALMGAGLVTPQRLLARVQSLATFVFALLLLIGAIVLLFAAIAQMVTMVVLFFAFPFGTIAYLIGWGFFPRGQTTALLGLIMFLKLVSGGSLLAAQPRFLANKGLVALVLTTVACTIVVQFLQGVVPGGREETGTEPLGPQGRGSARRPLRRDKESRLEW